MKLMANFIKSECKIVQHQKRNYSEKLERHEFEKRKGEVRLNGEQEDLTSMKLRSQK